VRSIVLDLLHHGSGRSVSVWQDAHAAAPFAEELKELAGRGPQMSYHLFDRRELSALAQAEVDAHFIVVGFEEFHVGAELDLARAGVRRQRIRVETFGPFPED
jgi:ferredoxin-NADP reductase